MPRYRFQDFVLSPRRRTLLRGGHELPLIPRYFDLLVFLIERRGQAVHRRDIFDHVWRDVVVSDSALSQAIRTIRRVLDDDSREPRFVRTVSRHGYRFVFEDVIEEEEFDEPTVQTTAEAETRPRVPIVLPGSERPLWLDAAMGAGSAGALAGAIGALLLASVPDARASLASVPVLALLGAGCGAAGAAGVMTGISLAARLSATPTTGRPSLAASISGISGSALGGGFVGLVAEWLGRWTLATLAGVVVPVGGLLPGLVIGAACGAVYMLMTSSTRPVEPATSVEPHDRPVRRPFVVAASFAAACGLAALALTAIGQPLVGGTLHLISKASAGAQTTLAPLGRMLGEQDFGPLTAGLIGTGEGLMFGAGLGLGLSRRRSFSNDSRTSHDLLTAR